MNKIEEMRNWLKVNPDKTDRDWLLEVRCKTNDQREDLKKLFAWVDEVNTKSEGRDEIFLDVCPMPLTVSGLHTMPPGSHPSTDWPGWGEPVEDQEIFFDFCLNRTYYDLDTPEDIYDFQANPIWNAPFIRTIKYFEWKADQLGIQNTNFAIRARECGKHGSGINGFPPHWKTLPDLYPTD